jgi:DGQHR domain-containing protein
MKKKPVKKLRPKLTEEQKKQKAEEQKKQQTAIAFRRKIRDTFIGAGFNYINTTGLHVQIGRRVIEVDAVFFYENIILICEDTTKTSKDKNHIRTKSEAFREIDENFSAFISKLREKFPDYSDALNKYSEDRYSRFCLYFSMEELGLSDDEMSMYSNLRFIYPKTLDYFIKMTQCIKYSAKYEIFRYLNISSRKIGEVISGTGKTEIQAPIIYPKETTGLHNGIRVVSFMMSAEVLLRTCYVLRKDNWEDSMWLYQRLIDKTKIKNIREFLANKSEAFYNNVIVALPNNVHFTDSKGIPKRINDMDNFEPCNIVLPYELNSICVIDGQHRIFAHYEGPASDRLESKISNLRKKLHLLVTGLIFPSNMSIIERTQIQSEIFLDINSNAKRVQPDVLLHIEMIKDPLSDTGLARRVIEKLNKKKIFNNKFEMSPLETSKIKIASIIKFALRYLVTISPSDGRASFYTYWNGDKDAMLNKDDTALEEYIEFCAENLNLFFSAVKKNNANAWHDPNSKLLSVIAINGFIIAYNRQLLVNGIKNFDFYDEKLRSFSIDYSKIGFEYTSSQYRKFSSRILIEAFGLDTFNL